MTLVIELVVRQSDVYHRESDTSDWLLTDRVSSWPGAPADRGWRYLRLSLERHDSSDTDFKYTKTSLETILSYDRLTPPPPWLILTLEVSGGPQFTLKHPNSSLLQNCHHEYLIRTALRYELFEDALEHISNLIKKVSRSGCRYFFLLTLGLVWEQTYTGTPQAFIKHVATVYSDRSGACCMSVVREANLEMCEPPAECGGGTLEQSKTDTKTQSIFSVAFIY